VSADNALILSPARLMNGAHSETSIRLPPPETADEVSTKKKKRFGRHRKKPINPPDKLHIACPPRFNQTNERALSFGDNSFDADNADYNLYAFVVRKIAFPQRCSSTL
jgi:hypothetical protein